MPKESISIVMTMVEDITGTLKSIASSSQGCSKQFEDLQKKAQQLGQRYQFLNDKAADTATKAKEIKKQMSEVEKAFKKTGAEDARQQLKALTEEYHELTDASKEYQNAAKETVKEIREVGEAARKINSNESSGNTNGLGNALAQAGLTKQLADSVSGFVGAAVESSIGQPMATLLSSTISGIGTGAAAGALLGSIIPGFGTLVGAGIGGVSGAISGSAEMFKAQDEAFKSYYQSLYETVSQATEEGLTNGKVLAASRETDRLSFAALLGSEGAAESFLKNVQHTANVTPFVYDDLTGISKTLLSFGYAVEDIIPTLTKVGDAGAAMGLAASDIGTVATYIGRMKSSDKASLEYLNPLNERGFGVFQWLADDLGTSQKDVYDKLSKSELSGSYVNELILSKFEQLFSGQMAAQSATTEGLDSTLEGIFEDIQAAGGNAYNALRNQGKNADIAAYGGALGKAMEAMNAISGENRAYGENLKAQYEREALSAVLLGEKTSVFNKEDEAKLKEMSAQFRTASAAYNETGDRKAAQAMEDLREDAQALAAAAYESSDWYQTLHDAELDQINAIRENTIGLEAATNAYEKSNAMTKGQGEGMVMGVLGLMNPKTEEETENWLSRRSGWNSHAFGLKRVPYDGYPALLHRDERVQTAQEARNEQAGSVQINFTGPITVRQESDLEEIAHRMAQEIVHACVRAG